MQEKVHDKSECLKRAAEVRRFARESGDAAEKIDLFWLSLAESAEENDS